MAIKNVYTVSSINELAEYNNSNCEIAFVNDKERTSGNPFRWAGSTLEVNGGTIQQGSGGVWEMMFDGPVNVNWFGALANGRDVTAQFQKAVDYAFQIAKPVYVPGNISGNFYSLGQINLYDNSIVYGDYRRTIIVPAYSNVKSIFNIQGHEFFRDVKTFNNLYKLVILNQVKGGPITTGCSAINVEFGDELHLSELIIDGFDINLNLKNCSSVYITKIRCRGAAGNNVRIVWHKPEAPPYLGSWIFMTECEFNGGNFAHATVTEKYSVFLENMSSATFDKCVIAGNSGGGIRFVQTYLSPATKKNMGYIVITGCDIDSNHGTGIRGELSRNCVIKGNWISSGRENKVSGIDLYNCESCSVTENQCFYNGNNGILITNCSYMTVANNVCANNGEVPANGCGIRSVSSNYNTFTGNICTAKKYDWPNGNQVNGILSDTNSDYNIYTSNILQTNEKPLQLSGSNNFLFNNIIKD